MSPTARRLILAFALLGVGASAASTYVHYRLLETPGYLSFCDINATFSCAEVYQSRYGSLWGVPVALAGLVWFALVLVLSAAAVWGSKTVAENVPAYLFALSTLGLAVVLYLGYASFFVLKTVCVLCVLTYAAVVGIFIVSGAGTTFPMTTLPRRAANDLRALMTSPLALAIAVLFVAGAASAVAFFPREVASAAAAQTPAGASDPAAPSEFERWYSAQERVTVPVPDDGAAVLIVKFNDYQCPPCRNTYLQYKSVFAKYQAERPGKVKLVTKDFPLESECNAIVTRDLHPAACEAAVAVRLARGKGRDEQMESWLFANQPDLTPQSVRNGAVAAAAISDFDARYAATLDAVKADVALGRLLGVRQTPTFFINGVKVEGGLPTNLFDAAIAYELKKAGQ